MLETISVNERGRESVEAAASTPTLYWQHYGLQQAPFDEGSQYAMFYSLAQWKLYIEFLQNFPKGDKPIVLITGVLGSGKSILAAQYMTQTGNEQLICSIKSHSNLRTAHVISNMIAAYELPAIDQDESVDKQISALLAAFKAQGKTGILLVDDAHRLPLESLTTLMQLVYDQPEHEKCLHLILLGEPQLEARVKNILGLLAQYETIPILELKPLTLDETKAYIRHRLTKAGLTGQYPFTENMLTRIFKLSGGIPGRINNAARLVMQDSILHAQRLATQKPAETHAFSLGDIFKNRTTGSVITLAAIGFIAWLVVHKVYHHQPYQPLLGMHLNQPALQKSTSQPQLVHSQPVNHAISTKQVVASAAVAAKPESALNAVTQPSVSKLATPNVLNSAPSLPVTNNAATTLVSAPKVEPIVNHPFISKTPNVLGANLLNPNGSTQPIPVAAVTAKPVTSIEPKPQESVAVNKMAAATPVQTTKPAAPVKTEAAAKQTISAEPSPKESAAPAAPHSEKISPLTKSYLETHQGYTVQLIGSFNFQDLKDFVRKNSLPGSIHYFRTTNEGKTWYVLVYGHYHDIEAAKAAINTLPADLRSQKPWVRSLEVIHEIIK